MVMNQKRIEPQVGPQTEILKTPANIAIFGGSAGGGKSYALLLEPLRHLHNPKFGAVIFRRTTKQVRNEGGLWDECLDLYSQFGAEFKSSSLECIFRSGMKIKFAHLEHDKDVYNWQGSQLAMIGFDELTHFTQSQFWYMLSRNRSMSGVPGYIRATCNAHADSWVRQLIDWWVDKDSGYPIEARSGVLRYFVRIDDKIHWADSSKELTEKFGSEALPKSLTFIPAKLEDNPILMDKDPGYRANLDALPLIERMRLKEGNWNVRATSGMFFRREWFEIIDALPQGQAIRYWDRAATEVSTKNKDPDWSVGIRVIRAYGIFYVSDICRIQATPHKVEQAILRCAKMDGIQTQIYLEQDPGQAGVFETKHYSKVLAGYDIRFNRVTKDKQTRAKPASAQAEAGNIKLLRAQWNEDFIKELVSFPESKHDDQVDALSGVIHCMGISQTGDFTENLISDSTIADDRLGLNW